MDYPGLAALNRPDGRGPHDDQRTAKAGLLGNPCILNADAVVKALDTDGTNGLTTHEASRRMTAYGPNALRASIRPPIWRKVLSQFRDPLVYLLLAAIAIASGAWIIEGAVGWPIDAIVIALVIILNGALGYVQEARAEDAVAALSQMTAVMSTVVRDGQAKQIPSAELVPGDLLVLGEGDAVGADARLIEAAALRVQEASLTGESEAVYKDVATLSGSVALADQVNMVFKGTAVVQGTGRAMVVTTGMATRIGSIAAMLDATKEEPSPLQKEISRIGRMLGVAVVIIACAVVGTIFVISDIRSAGDVLHVLLLGVSLAVAAVPEGLPAILSVVLAMGVQRMARHNAIVKKLSSVETLGSASVIASDKTGTLTRSEMTIERVMTASGSTRVTGVGYAPVGRLEDGGGELGAGPLLVENIVALSGGSLAGNAALHKTAEGTWEIHGDPTEAAFLVAEQKLGANERRTQRFERLREIPFTSERKIMSTIQVDHEHHDALVVITKGAPDVLLKLCSRVRIGATVVELDDSRRRRILADVDALSDAALRTLAVAYRPLDPAEDPHARQGIEQDLIFVGTVGMLDPPRAEAGQAIREAQRAGIRVLMITGDHPRTAARIAADLGIVDAGAAALTGDDIDQLDDAAFTEAIRTVSVYARVAPEHKLRIVDALQAQGNVVAMTGDGVNDAPALKSADIGIAMGRTGTEVTKEAAKMILADDNFATIVHAVREGRGIFDNIRKSVRYLLSSNMGEVLTVFLGVVLAGVLGITEPGAAVVLPLLATQILWINLLTDSGPALAMGVDPDTEDVMARKPRGITDRMVDASMWAVVVQIGVVMAVVSLLTIDMYLPGGLIEGQHDLATARTAGFTVLVFAQLYNCFNARSHSASAFDHLFVNRWLWAAVGLSIALQVAVVHLDFLNVAFGTVPLDPGQWLTCAVMASIVLWFSEIRKWISRNAFGRLTES